MRRIVLIGLLVLFFSCSNDALPKGVPEPPQMYHVVKDLIQVDEYITNVLSKDTTVNIKQRRSMMYEQVFMLHHTTRKEFYQGYRFYLQRPDLQKVLFDSLYEGLKTKNITLPTLPKKDTASTDTTRAVI